MTDELKNLICKINNKNEWKKKTQRINNWTGNYWEHKHGDILRINTIQDRDGKNAFVHTAERIDRSSIGTGRGKHKIIARGRNEKKVLAKLKKYMGGSL